MTFQSLLDKLLRLRKPAKPGFSELRVQSIQAFLLDYQEATQQARLIFETDCGIIPADTCQKIAEELLNIEAGFLRLNEILESTLLNKHLTPSHDAASPAATNRSSAECRKGNGWLGFLFFRLKSKAAGDFTKNKL